MRILEHEIGVLLRRIRRVINERAQMVHPELNTTAYYLLGTLNEFGPRRASELAETFSLDKGAVSRVVHQLMELDLVERRPDPEDGRASILQVTELGRRRMEEVSDLRRRQVSARLADWDPDDLETLNHGLARYNQALADLDAESPATQPAATDD